MSYNLFLDDEREPSDVTWVQTPKNAVIVRSYTEFVDCITKNGLPAHISFDHDLGYEHYAGLPSKELTGFHCAIWLVDYCMDNGLKLPPYVVHSMNPIGKQKIIWHLESAKAHI